jgi:hypothetical protein
MMHFSCAILAARICADGVECGRLVQYGLVEANRRDKCFESEQAQ